MDARGSASGGSSDHDAGRVLTSGAGHEAAAVRGVQVVWRLTL